MTLKPCIMCGEPSNKSRCPQHRPKDRKPPRQQRGYDNQWEQLSKRARRLQPFCHDCGRVENLQADHTPEAWARKTAGLPIRLQDIDVVCGDCNIRRGAARGDTPNHTRPHPLGKARGALHTGRLDVLQSEGVI